MNDDEQLTVVGIGASAGGLEALQKLLSNLPDNLNAAFIIAQHLSPTHSSMLVEILSRDTKKLVTEARHLEEIKTDVIYICPPNKDIKIFNNKILLSPPRIVTASPKPLVDLLFMSLAEIKKEKAIAIILSGTGSDGSHGIRAIKAEGGITIAQDPKTAKYDGMPLAAINTHNVDLILPPEQIGIELKEIIDFSREYLLEKQAQNLPDCMERILEIVKERRRVDFSHYKMNTINRRIHRRMAALKIPSLLEYLTYLESSAVEADELYKDILIGVTSFFRDTEAFNALRGELEAMLAKKNAGDNIRVWDVGCSTGEEIYSIAIIMFEILGDRIRDFNVQIFATDIDENAIAIGRKGLYPVSSMALLPKLIVDKYFVFKKDQYEIAKKIREMVIFSHHDVTRDPPFMRLDMVSCRNMLIYFDQELQTRVFESLRYGLNNQGLLFLGKSESVGQSPGYFSAISTKLRIYKKEFSGVEEAPKFSSSHFSRFKTVSLKDQVVARDERPLDDVLKDVISEIYMPMTCLVNDNMDIVYVRGEIPYLRIPSGVITKNIFKIVVDEFSVDLRSALHKCVKEKTVQKTHFRIITGQKKAQKFVRAVVYPVENIKEFTTLFGVCFQEESPDDLGSLPLRAGNSKDSTYAEIRAELHRTKEHLQTVIEELETTNEELQSLNEELQSANEELQSTNEELETSNEELQATNEELNIAYTELRVSYDEKELQTQSLERLNKEVLAHDKLLEGVLGSSLDGVMVFKALRDEDGRIFDFVWLHSNERACKIIQKSRDELVGKRLLELMPGNKDEGLFDKYVESVEKRVEGRLEFFYEHEGLKEWIVNSYVPYEDGFIVSFTVVSDEKHREHEIKRKNETINRILHSSLNAIYIYSFEWSTNIFVNDAYTKITGYSKEELSEMGGEGFGKILHPDELEMVGEHIQRVNESKDGELFDIKCRLRRKDGSWIWCYSRNVVLDRQKDGRALSMLGTFEDITESVEEKIGLERMIESEIEKRRASDGMLIQQHKLVALGEMVSMIAHQWRQPLNNLSLSQGLIQDALDEKVIDREMISKRLKTSMEQIEYMSQTIDDFRGFYKKSDEPKLFCLKSAIESSLGIISKQISSYEIKVATNLQEGVQVMGVENQLKQALLNIINNSKDAILQSREAGKTYDGEIKLVMKKDKKGILIEISDNGSGIKDEIKERIFEPYFTTKHSSVGTGLGLYITKTILERYFDATISISNIKGGGAKFSIRLAKSS